MPVQSRLIFLLTLLIMAIQPVLAEQNKPSTAVVQEGSARFTLLTDRLIRMEFDSQQHFEDRQSMTFVNRQQAVPDYQVSRDEQWLQISTQYIKLRYRRHSSEFTADNLAIELMVDGRPVKWHPGKKDTANLLGTTRTVDGFKGRVNVHNGEQLELEQGILSRDGWHLVDDSDNLMFDEANWVSDHNKDQQDWYFFGYAHQYKDALRDYTRIAGKIPLPPRYAFGYWWSRYWVYSDGEIRDLVDTVEQYDIPMDVLIVDMDWHNTYGLTSNQPKPTPFKGMLGWTGYSWNKAVFPEPERFLQWTEDKQLKVALNLHPADGIAPMEDHYQDMLNALDDPVIKDDWLAYRMSDKNWSEAFFEQILRPLEKQGVDFWWLDWQQWPTSKFVAGLNNTFWLNHTFFTDMQRTYPQRRPLLFHRWGGLGNHRYQVGFSGDAVISWDSLAFQPYFTSTAANVGYGYWSHDIGGHIVDDKAVASDGELYLRWIQFGALSPIFRTHSSKTDVAERRIWMYPQYFPAMRDAIKLRYSLAPYLYNAGYQAWQTGVSMIRPMYYDYPEQSQAYQSPAQYMLGDDMIVAPVTQKADPDSMLASQSVWLPSGQWFDISNGALLEGNREINGLFSIKQIPIYARAGAIIAQYPELDNLKSVPDKLLLTVFPGADGQMTLFEDDGMSNAYQQGGGAITRMESKRNKEGLSLHIFPVEGDYQGMPQQRSYRIRLPMSLVATQVKVNGKLLPKAQQSYDGKQLTQIIDIPVEDSRQDIHIDIDYPADWQAAVSALSGKAGYFDRLNMLGDKLKLMSARQDWGATIPDSILQVLDTATKINYHPNNLLDDIKTFDQGVAGLQDNIDGMPQISANEAKQLTAFLQQFQLTGETND
ncbi:TIM-barrel domain-containing protein [Neptunicella sp. SCSIO 80796]|uniref:glycoside hydrolase family 31 protein n=1 Tax=Neptunicella plasticusilytica TaxID=3117012 RepID=UPI003A4E628E